jgi:hypothetical protein
VDSEKTPMLSALSPRYPALYDEESGVFFHLGKASVTVEQALKLAERPFVDGIEIGSFDEDGRTVDAVPAKKWANARHRDGEVGEDVNDKPEDDGEPELPQDAPPLEPKTDEAVPPADKKASK